MDVTLFKKSHGLFHTRQSSIKVIRAMKKVENHLKLSRLCQLMNVPIASYYYRPIDKPETAQYIETLTIIHKENPQAYGRRRMKTALDDESIQLGAFKISRLMREAGSLRRCPKRPTTTTHRASNCLISPNQLNRQLNPGQVNRHWVGDITYIRHHDDWSYLATVLDLGSREIVGYALSQTPDAQLARQALLNAIKMQQPDTLKLMFHSDQGV